MARRIEIIRQRRGGARRERGVALIMVLGALAILTVMLTEFQDETSAELGSALSERDALKAEYAARSAINLTRLLIAAEPTVRKAVAPIMMLTMKSATQIPVWEHADKVLGAFNDEAGVQSFATLAGVEASEAKNLGLPGAAFEVRVVDEDSKINVNIAAKGDAFSQQRVAQQLIGLMAGPQYDRMFERRDSTGNFHDRQSVCSAIVDWTDPDQDAFSCDLTTNTAQSSGAEDSYYQMLKVPYERKNAALDSLEELHRVRGITDDFWATFVEPKEDPASRVVTVWGSGGINVNTANELTLLALIRTYATPASPINADIAEQAKFLTAVRFGRMMLPGIPMFSTPKSFVNALKGKGMGGMMLQAAQLKPIELISDDLLMKAITTESKVFSIYATGQVKSGKRETRVRVHAVVDFRAAPPPGVARLNAALEAAQLASGASPSGTGGSGGAGGAGGAAALPAGAQQGAIAAALQPSPGGNIIYYRVE